MDVSIIPCGKFGLTLAYIYAHKFGKVKLWLWEDTPAADRDGKLSDALKDCRKARLVFPSDKYPEVSDLDIPEGIQISTNLEDVLNGADILISALPGEVIGKYLEQLKGMHFKQFVNASKGVVDGDIIYNAFRRAMLDAPYAVISGPNIAYEILQNFIPGKDISPAFSTLAKDKDSDGDLLEKLRHMPYLRLYPFEGIEAVEYCGILKQIYALALGMCLGLGLPKNTIWGVFSACQREMERILEAEGLNRDAMKSYAGTSDLGVTYDSGRHGQLGIIIGQNLNVEEGLAQMHGETLEGIRVIKVVYEKYRERILRSGEDQKQGSIHLPILMEMHEIFYSGKPIRKAMEDLKLSSRY